MISFFTSVNNPFFLTPLIIQASASVYHTHRIITVKEDKAKIKASHCSFFFNKNNKKVPLLILIYFFKKYQKKTKTYCSMLYKNIAAAPDPCNYHLLYVSRWHLSYKIAYTNNILNQNRVADASTFCLTKSHYCHFLI